MSPGCTIRLAFLWMSHLCFSMFILLLPLLGMGAKSIFLSPGFCVRRPKQYDTLYWETGIISGFIAFYWLVVWRIDTINVDDIFQEAGDLESLPRLLDCLICTRECHFHCIVISNDGALG